MTERRSGGATEALRAALEEAQSVDPARVSWSGPDADKMPGAIAALRQAGYTVHPPGEVCGIVPGARRTDPSTSAQAAERAAPRAKSVAAKLLAAYGFEERVEGRTERSGSVYGVPVFGPGLTADEAAQVALSLDPTARLGGSWRRISDLGNAGLIEPAVVVGTSSPVTRPGDSGREQVVWQITPAGRELLASWREATP